MADLLNCPFCGGEAELDEHQEYRNISTGTLESAIAVYCSTCGAQHSICRGDIPDIQPAEVIEMWNRRSTVIPAEIAGVVERVGCRLRQSGLYKDAQLADELTTLIERIAASQAPLAEMAKHLNWELDWGNLDPSDETSECGWRVHASSGNRNDREWTLTGFGDTPEEAIRRALIGPVKHR